MSWEAARDQERLADPVGEGERQGPHGSRVNSLPLSHERSPMTYGLRGKSAFASSSRTRLLCAAAHDLHCPPALAQSARSFSSPKLSANVTISSARLQSLKSAGSGPKPASSSRIDTSCG